MSNRTVELTRTLAAPASDRARRAGGRAGAGRDRRIVRRRHDRKTLDGVITQLEPAVPSACTAIHPREGRRARNVVCWLVPADRPDEVPKNTGAHRQGANASNTFETRVSGKDRRVLDVSVHIWPIRRQERPQSSVLIYRSRPISTRPRPPRPELRRPAGPAPPGSGAGESPAGPAGKCHDFNNLLAGIINYATSSPNGLGHADPSPARARRGPGGPLTLAQDVG